ncbi:MAG: arginyltransferase [Desulfobulbaceae bacterium]|nr:arginyltransferase [Desulfobulbaceae bacterium]
MSIHEESKHLASESSLARYFGDISVDCPYGLNKEAVYYQARFGSIREESLDFFLDQGYRRNGNYLYTMHCPECHSCVPIRLPVEEFRPNRSQQRVMRKNDDISFGMAPLQMSQENLQLLDKFLDKRFPMCKSNALSYYSSFFLGNLTRSFEIRYRLGDELLGVSIVDFSDNWLNAVYFYFDPAEKKRSLGTFNILTLINFCQQYDIGKLYLGYWIENISAMTYKSNFNPHELRLDNNWQKIDKRS